MTNLSLDDLFAIAEASPLFDKAEAALRADPTNLRYQQQADVLLNLQRDAGVLIAREMDPDYDPKAGYHSAQLDRNCAPVTRSRVEVVLSEVAALMDAGMRAEMQPLLVKLSAPAAVISRSQPSL